MYKIDYVHETIRKQRCQKAKVIYMRKKSIKSNKYYYEQLQHIEQGGGVGWMMILLIYSRYKHTIVDKGVMFYRYMMCI